MDVQKIKEIILLYSTDAWHSYASHELVGMFSDEDELNNYLSEMKRTNELTDYDMAMLASQNQTQGRDTNYLVKTETINPEYGH